MLILNFGCGENKIEGAVNCDMNIATKPDVVCDLKENLPFRDSCANEIFLIHVIEHIEKPMHYAILKEFRRVLKNDCLAIFAFPEFIKCAQNYIDNKRGQRSWWEKTIFGRQAWKEDYHVCAMNSEEFRELLYGAGFGKVVIAEESEGEPYNTFVMAKKMENPPVCERQEVFAQEIFV